MAPPPTFLWGENSYVPYVANNTAFPLLPTNRAAFSTFNGMPTPQKVVFPPLHPTGATLILLTELAQYSLPSFGTIFQEVSYSAPVFTMTGPVCAQPDSQTPAPLIQELGGEDESCFQLTPKGVQNQVLSLSA